MESTNVGNVKIVTKVEAHKVVAEELIFADNLKITALISEAKETAKSFFFNDMATSVTLKMMGAQT